MSDLTPGTEPNASASAQVSSIVFMKAMALQKTGMAEIDYSLEVEDQYGNKAKDEGTIRAQPFKVDVPDYPSYTFAPQDRPPESGEGRNKGFFGRGK